MFDRDHCYAWDPRRAAAPLSDFSLVEEMQGIHRIAHLSTPSYLRSIVTTMDRPIHELRDFEPYSTYRLYGEAVTESNPTLGGPILFPDEQQGSLFGLVEPPHGPIAKILPDGKAISMLSLGDVARMIPNLPGMQPYWNEKTETEKKVKVQYKDSSLSLASIDGEAVLAVRVWIKFRNGVDDSLILFIKPTGKGFTTIAHFYKRDAILWGHTILRGPDGMSRLFATLANNSYHQIVFARCIPTSKGMVCVEESSLRNSEEHNKRHDMMLVTATDLRQGFASDEEGGLFVFSIGDGAYREIDRDKDSFIQSVVLVTW